jgi:hypothetical protein
MALVLIRSSSAWSFTAKSLNSSRSTSLPSFAQHFSQSALQHFSLYRSNLFGRLAQPRTSRSVATRRTALPEKLTG